MKKIKLTKMIRILAFIIIILSNPFICYSEWKELPGYAPLANFYALDIVDSNTYVLGGVGGIIRVTCDDGKSWIDNIMQEALPINFINCVDDSVFFCCSDQGYIYKSTNKGKYWSLIKSGTEANLLRIAFSRDKSFGIAAGSEGKIIFSNDGGNHWNSIESGAKGFQNWIDFYDDSTAFVVGDSGSATIIYEKGKKFEKLKISEFNHFRRICILENKKIFIAADSLILFTSIDKGKTWLKSNVEPNFSKLFFNPAYINFQFLNDNEANFRIYDNVKLAWYEYATNDGGTNWKKKNLWTSLTGPDFGFEISKIRLLNKNFGIGIGNGALYKIAIGDDMFMTYKSSYIEHKYDIDVMSAISEDNISFISGRDLFYYSTDGGLHWNRKTINTNYFPDFNSRAEYMSQVNENLIIISFSTYLADVIEDFLYRSTDGGNNFYLIRDSANEYFANPRMINNKYGFMPYGFNYMNYTCDGAATFQKFPLLNDTCSSCVNKLFSPQPGYVYKHRYNYKKFRGYFQRTTDWGNNWEKYEDPIYNYMDKFIFSDSNNGWAYGHYFSIVNGKNYFPFYLARTFDGGKTWSKTFNNDTNEISDCRFIDIQSVDSSFVVALTLTSEFYISKDGGKSWNKEIIERLGTDEVRFFAAVKYNTIFAVTWGDRIFKYQSNEITEVKFNPYTKNYQYISPNPANDFIEIFLPDDMNQRFKSLVQDVWIYNVFGELVNPTKSQVYPTPTLPGGEGVRLDVSSLTPGLYFVRVGERVGKFLKL